MLKLIFKEEDGQDMIEYALLVAIIALGAVAALGNFQNSIGNVWNAIANSLSGS